MRCPYTLYKEKAKQGLSWYARFWDERSHRYAVSRSLGILVEGKRERRREAEEKARMLVTAVQAEFKTVKMPVKKNRELPLVSMG
jgi:hypothetical protein